MPGFDRPDALAQTDTADCCSRDSNAGAEPRISVRSGAMSNDPDEPTPTLHIRGNEQKTNGAGGIRTHEDIAALHDFKSCAFNRSATAPACRTSPCVVS